MSMSSKNFKNAVSITTSELISLANKSQGVSLRYGMIRSAQSGDHKSFLKGRGMEYDESRLYLRGDDVRNIDWRVTARTGKAHTKLFKEEHEQPVHLWVDYRDSMFFATRGKLKSVIATELASIFAWATSRQGDRVGGVLFSDRVRHELKPQHGKSAVLHLIRKMVEHPAWERKGNIKRIMKRSWAALHSLRRIVRPGSLVILISDFRGFDDKMYSYLLKLCKHNDVVIVHVYDRMEVSLPSPGLYRLTDGVSEFELNTNNKKLADDYKRKFIEHKNELLKIARLNNINYLACCTEDDPYKVIKRGLCL